MKKIYNTPKIDVVMICNTDIIADSGNLRMNGKSIFGGNDSPDSEEGVYGD